jgi:serine/threonine protein kinase
MRKVARAVHVAHKAGVLHLDLKPENILMTDALDPVVADFGIGRFLESVRAPEGVVAGTPGYMSPEQANPGLHPIGVRSDIYALGAVLRQLLPAELGDPPSDANFLQRWIWRASGRFGRRRLTYICDRCCAADPSNRYKSARAVAADLTRFLKHRQPNGIGGERAKNFVATLLTGKVNFSLKVRIFLLFLILLALLATGLAAAVHALRWMLGH